MRVIPRVATRKVTAAAGSTRFRVSSIRRRVRGCRSQSSRNTAEKRPSSEAALQPTTSLWSSSGSSCAKAGILAFSLIWVFQR